MCACCIYFCTADLRTSVHDIYNCLRMARGYSPAMRATCFEVDAAFITSFVCASGSRQRCSNTRQRHGWPLLRRAGPYAGWRLPFVIVAVPTLLLALLMLLTAEEPPRGVTEAALQVPLTSSASIRLLWSNSLYVCVGVGIARPGPSWTSSASAPRLGLDAHPDLDRSPCPRFNPSPCPRPEHHRPRRGACRRLSTMLDCGHSRAICLA